MNPLKTAGIGAFGFVYIFGGTVALFVLGLYEPGIRMLLALIGAFALVLGSLLWWQSNR